MASFKSVLLIGPGYVGLSLLDSLLEAKYNVSTLLRNVELAAKLSSSGARTIIGTLDDSELITAQVAQHELTINTSSSDHLPSINAILSGIRQRVEAGLPSTLIHTSGAGLFLDEAKGEYKSDVLYRDDDPAKINAVPDTALHREIDLAVLAAAREFGDKAKLAIMMPPVIYGMDPKHNRMSIAQPILVKFALKHGFAGYVGKGANVWGYVHVRDLVKAFATLIAYLDTPGSQKDVLENPYFFADDGEFTWGQFAERIARVLHRMGKISEARVEPFEKSHYADAFGDATEFIFGGNARTKAVRLVELGWKATEKDVLDTLEEEEIPFIVEQQKS